MGQSQSQNYSGICTPKKRSSLRSPFMRRKQRSPLSAVFTAPNTNNIDALNINAATVEQLMTLPGITRQIAQGIVEHRTAIGGRFQRVDDLALVSGIGAEKLDKIRSDICVKRKTVGSMNGSCISSRTPSMDSVTSEPIIREQKLVINVNKATVFQLQQINGLNQEIAANLVDYRTRKGNFNCLDDIIKVKGISQARLGAIRIHLSLSDDDLPKTPKLRHVSTFTSTPISIKNGYHNNNNNNINQQQQQQNNHRQINRKSMSMPTKMSLSLTNSNNNNHINNNSINNGYKNAPVHDIFELLGAFEHRPIVEEDYRHERNGFSTIRMTTWNLDRMCFDKSENLGVKEVICRTVLENRLSILCLQEILDPSALNNICDELNCPSLKRVQEWRENSKNWKCFTNKTSKDGELNGLGFIYDADFCQFVENDSIEISLIDCIDTNTDLIEPTAYLAAFKLSDWTCYVLNIYLRYFNLLNTNSVLKTIEKQLDKRIKQKQQHDTNKITSPTLNDVFLVAGDFSGTNYQENYNNLSKKIAKFNKVDELIKQTKQQKLNKQHNKDRDDDINEIKTDSSSATTVDIDLQNLGFFSVIEIDSTSYNSQHQQSQTASNNLHNHNHHSHHNNHCNPTTIISSCNILCREKLPIKKQQLQTHDLREQILLNTKMPIINNYDMKKEKLTGHSGIVRQGLCHMAIPHNWSWGAPVSSHCPIWVEIYRRINRDEVDINQTQFRNSTSYLMNGSSGSGIIGGERIRRKLYSKSRSPSVGKKLNSSKESLSSRKNYKISNGGGNLIGNGNLNISSDSVFISQTDK